MTRRPIIIADPTIDQHPALEAWNRRRSTRDKLATLEVWRDIKNLHGYKSLVYRLVFRDGGRQAVFAKHCQAGEGQHRAAVLRGDFTGPRCVVAGVPWIA